MLINDDECDTEYPDVLDEERGTFDTSAAAVPPPATLLLASVHVTRLLAPLSKLFRSLCITNETLTKFESHLVGCLRLLPPSLQLSSTNPIDPRGVYPLIYFQNTRLMLHRHNLSPSCSAEQRSQAIEQLLLATRETAAVISRCMTAQAHPQEVEQRLSLAATTLFCTHIWRCMLFMLFRPLDDAFFVLLRACRIIGSTKAVNISCGRHLTFCLRKLIDKMEQPGPPDLDQDEEMLVYLSGDLQASTNSWVWGNAETGTHLSRRQKHGRPKQISRDSDSLSPVPVQSPSWPSTLSSEEQQDWGGWQQVDGAARYLQQLQEKRRRQQQMLPQERPVGLLPRLGSFPSASEATGLRPTTGSPSTPSSESGKSRMTIANII